MNTLIKQYLSEIASTKAEKTVADYTERLKRFSNYLRGRDEFTRQIAVSFILSLKQKEFGEASRSLHLMTIKGFYSWLTLNGHIEENCLTDAPLPAYHSPSRSNDFGFTADEYRKIKEQFSKRQDPEWLLACVIAWNTGLRLSDVVHLEWQNVDLEHRRIFLVPHKTKRFRKSIEIPMSDELKSMLSVRAVTHRFVLPGLAGEYDQCGSQRLSVEFGRVLESIEIIGKSFHSFRHSFTSRLLNAGTPISVVSSITGQTMKTLQRYSHVSMEEKHRFMERLVA